MIVFVIALYLASMGASFHYSIKSGFFEEDAAGGVLVSLILIANTIASIGCIGISVYGSVTEYKEYNFKLNKCRANKSISAPSNIEINPNQLKLKRKAFELSELISSIKTPQIANATNSIKHHYEHTMNVPTMLALL